MGRYTKNPIISLKTWFFYLFMGARGAPLNHQYIPAPMVIHARKRLPAECPIREIEARDC